MTPSKPPLKPTPWLFKRRQIRRLAEPHRLIAKEPLCWMAPRWNLFDRTDEDFLDQHPGGCAKADGSEAATRSGGLRLSNSIPSAVASDIRVSEDALASDSTRWTVRKLRPDTAARCS